MLRLQLLFLFLSSSSVIRHCASSPPPGCPKKTCGKVNVSYPFWLAEDIQQEASSSSSYCGYRGFNISCREGETPILRLDDYNFIVKGINYDAQVISLSDSDVVYPDVKCPRVRHNLTLEGDASLFVYTSGDANLYFLFNCSQLPLRAINCFSDATTVLQNYVFLEDDILEAYHPSCQEVVTTTVLRSALSHAVFNGSLLVDGFGGVLKGGFELEWRSSTEHGCDRCQSSGGLCGYNITGVRFTCYCSDGIHDGSCGMFSTSQLKPRLIVELTERRTEWSRF